MSENSDTPKPTSFKVRDDGTKEITFKAEDIAKASGDFVVTADDGTETPILLEGLRALLAEQDLKDRSPQ